MELRELAALAQGLDAGERAELLAALQGAELPAEPVEPAELVRGLGGAERAEQRTAQQSAEGPAQPASSDDDEVTREAPGSKALLCALSLDAGSNLKTRSTCLFCCSCRWTGC